MTDLIQKARKEWCDPYVVNPLCAKDAHYKTCPPEVVAALLDVLEEIKGCEDCPCCGVQLGTDCEPWCWAAAAEAAITRALEDER